LQQSLLVLQQAVLTSSSHLLKRFRNCRLKQLHRAVAKKFTGQHLVSPTTSTETASTSEIRQKLNSVVHSTPVLFRMHLMQTVGIHVIPVQVVQMSNWKMFRQKLSMLLQNQLKKLQQHKISYDINYKQQVK